MIGSRGEAGDDFVVCPGCGLRLPCGEEVAASLQGSSSAECLRLCHELSLYTLAHGDPFFIHQVVVDAYAAQHAGPESKPIGVAFALIGLCLLLERGHTGKAVQRAHMRLARGSKQWPAFDPPSHRGSVTIADVLRADPGADRDAAITQWAASVWKAWAHAHPAVRDLIDTR
ncbi:MAG: DUF5946 family protein [Isosphaeraceae bacterium]|nr:DUF5946 family protein [Isosphaeraceae bacterium]